MTNPDEQPTQQYPPAYEYPALYGQQLPEPVLYPSSHTPVPETFKETPKWVIVAVLSALVVFLIVVALLIAHVIQNKDTAGGGGTFSSAAPAPVFTIPPTAKSKSDKQRLQAWTAEHHVVDQLSLIQSNMNNISQAALAVPTDYEGLQSNCHDLAINTTLFRNSALPTPFPNLTEELSLTMQNYSSAGELCTDFDSSSTAVEIQPATDLITEGNAHMRRANAILDSIR